MAEDGSDHSQIHDYALTDNNSSQVVQSALAHLKPHLPTAIAVYRRLQFGRFFPATRLLSNLDLGDQANANGTFIAPTEPWLIAFVDRSCRPETEVWLYASWEDDKNPGSDPTVSTDVDDLVTALVRSVKALGVPASIHQTPSEPDKTSGDASTVDSVGFSRADYAGHMSDPNVMLWGAVHEATTRVMQRLDLLALAFRTGVVSNDAFVWNVDELDDRVDAPLPPSLDASTSLQWGSLRPEHFALVRSRTSIPRQDRTLAVLPSLALFDGEKPVAWVFVGLDASLTTLHVETEYRRRGLAKLLTVKLFKEKMDGFWEDGVPRWAHGYVIAGNEASAAMCRSIGGQSMAQCYWLRVDLRRA